VVFHRNDEHRFDTLIIVAAVFPLVIPAVRMQPEAAPRHGARDRQRTRRLLMLP
jgi:hypothetical protein